MLEKTSVLELGKVFSYPLEVLEVVREEIEIFRAWEFDFPGRNAASYDKAITKLCDALGPFSVRGWHCARLMPHEISNIRSDGLRLPCREFLAKRLGALLKMCVLTDSQSQLLYDESQVEDSNRKGMIWFCFYKPHYAGENGISRLLSYWGGEAVYWAFEDDPAVGELLRSIGIPVVVEVDVPIDSLRSAHKVAVSVIRSYLKSLGEKVVEPINVEHYSVRDVNSRNIRCIHEFPSEDFKEITGCSRWRKPLFSIT